MTASFRRKLILSLASSLAALILVTGGVGIQRKLQTFRTPGDRAARRAATGW